MRLSIPPAHGVRAHHPAGLPRRHADNWDAVRPLRKISDSSASRLPTSNLFLAGHQIRVTITGADPIAEDFPRTPAAPTVTIDRNFAYPFYVSLLVIAPSDDTAK